MFDLLYAWTRREEFAAIGWWTLILGTIFAAGALATALLIATLTFGLRTVRVFAVGIPYSALERAREATPAEPRPSEEPVPPPPDTAPDAVRDRSTRDTAGGGE